MKHESAAAGEENTFRFEVNKVGAYSYKRIRNEKTKLPTKKCYRCDSPVCQYQTHKRVQSLKSTMQQLQQNRSFAKVCQQKNVNCVDNKKDQEDVTQETTEMDTYQLHSQNVQLLNNLPKFTTVKNDFKKNLLVNNRLIKILINTGAITSVCGEQQAKLWRTFDKIKPSFAKMHPVLLYQQKNIVPVEFYILPGSCDLILDENKTEQLKIISSDKDDNNIFNTVLIISSQKKDGEFINNIFSILKHCRQIFKGFGKL